MNVVQIVDVARLRSFLSADRAWADYALGDLEPDFFPQTQWQGVEAAGELSAVVMQFNGFRPPIVFAMGAGDAIGALIDRGVTAPEIGLSIREEHLQIVDQYYDTAARIPMWKMALEAADFRPIGAGQPERLSVADAPALYALYAFGGGDAFSPAEIERGVFYGVRDHGQIVAVAGTHVVSDNARVAALGNVMTHPAWRGRGLATIATSAVCATLIDRGVRTIGLSVARENAAAIRVYEKIGFRKHVPFFEGVAQRKQIEISKIRLE